MSEETTTPTTETTAPVATPAVAVPTPVDAKSAAKAAVFASLAAREQATPATPAPEVPATPPAAQPDATQVTIDATGRAHAPDGKYVAAPAATANEGIRVPVPEGHWLRDQGVTEQFARDETEARRLKGLFKDASRKSEVMTLREQLVAAQAQLRAAQESQQSIVTSPEVLADIQYLRSPEVNRPDLADLIIKGLEADKAIKAQGYEKEARQQFEQQDAETAVIEFRDTAFEAATQRYPKFWVESPSFNDARRKAVWLYANEIAFEEQTTGRPVTPTLDGVWQHMDKLYLSDPEAMRVVKAQIDRRRQQPPPVPSDAQQRHATLPALSTVPSAVRTDRLSTTPAAIDTTGLSADGIKKQLKRALIYGA